MMILTTFAVADSMIVSVAGDMAFKARADGQSALDAVELFEGVAQAELDSVGGVYI